MSSRIDDWSRRFPQEQQSAEQRHMQGLNTARYITSRGRGSMPGAYPMYVTQNQRSPSRMTRVNLGPWIACGGSGP